LDLDASWSIAFEKFNIEALCGEPGNGLGSITCSGIQAPGSWTLPEINARATPAAPAAAASACV
jgi:hypothetical protein